MTAVELDRPPARPRYATPRRPERPTLGPLVGRLYSATFGRPPLPWQQAWWDVAYELDPATGRRWYSMKVETVPRQMGKTDASKITIVHAGNRAGGPRQIVYAAQNGVEAGKKWEELAEYLQRHRTLARTVDVRRTVGKERIKFRRTGSTYSYLRKSADAGHGGTNHVVILDELWSHQTFEIVQGIEPTQMTVADAELWLKSTMGDDDSVVLNHYVEQARAEVDDPTSRVCLVEYSAGDDDDPADPDTWWRCMPALGYTVGEDFIADKQRTWPAEEFARAFLNRKAQNRVRIIPAARWDDGPARGGSRDPSAEIVGPVTFAVDVAFDRSRTAIAVAGYTADGSTMGEVVDARPGTSWAGPRLVELWNRHGGECVLDPFGPARMYVAELDRANVPVYELNAGEVASACGTLYDAIVEEGGSTFRHLGQPILDAAAASACKRPIGEAWAFGRRSSGAADISPLTAVTFARWRALSRLGEEHWTIL